MKCKACGGEVPEDASFCIQCGVHLETGARANGDAPDSAIYPLLTAANLFRMRRDWVAAEQKAIEVLRLYPNNATAHSLLGDIYADQARWEEAAQWYEMALDLDPDNRSDRAKLERARQQAAGAEEPEPEAGPSARRSGLPELRFSPLLQLVVIAVVSFGVVLVVLGLRARPREETLRPTEGFGVALPGSNAPLGSANTPAASLAPANPTASSSSGQSAPPETPPPAPTAAGTPAEAPAVATSPAPEMSEWEARAFSRLQTDSWLAAHSRDIRVTSVVWEPIDQRALATVVILQSPGLSGLRDLGLRVAFATGQALARIGFQRFEVMVKAPVQEGRGTEVAIAALADAARPQTWVEDPGAARPEALLMRFTSIWWHPRLQQAP